MIEAKEEACVLIAALRSKHPHSLTPLHWSSAASRGHCRSLRSKHPHSLSHLCTGLLLLLEDIAECPVKRRVQGSGPKGHAGGELSLALRRSRFCFSIQKPVNNASEGPESRPAFHFSPLTSHPEVRIMPHLQDLPNSKQVIVLLRDVLLLYIQDLIAQKQLGERSVGVGNKLPCDERMEGRHCKEGGAGQRL